MAIITKSARLIIREFLPEEKPLFLTLLTDPRLTAYLPKRNEEEICEKFNETLSDYLQQVKLTRWAVFNAAGTEFVGLGILKGADGEPLKAELGYVIHHQYKAKGLATELANALLKYGFEGMQLNEIFAVTCIPNTPSQRVLEKSGLIRSGNIIRNDEELTFYKISSNKWFDLKR